ncbi:MAG: hypothetical protein B7C24_11110 [Bacteroidetes bacterium 4572_77]|nr:MAG: hypothetical protein B7C24_11110 [Bacteroidetes bacterium 4572_77]
METIKDSSNFLENNTKVAFALVESYIELSLHALEAELAKELQSFELDKQLYEANLINSELTKYKMAFDKSHSAMAIATTEGILVNANKSWVEMHKYKSEESLKGMHLSVFHNKRQLEEDVKPALDDMMQRGVSDREVGHVDIEGQEINTIMTSARLKNALNGDDAVLGVATDITYLKKEEQRLSQIIEALPFGVLFIDPEDYSIVRINKAAQEYIGAKRHEIVGKKCVDFVCPEFKGNCPVKDLKEKVDNSERVLINAKGERIPILKTVKELIWNGKTLFIESFIDITSLKIAQNQAEESSRLKAAFLSNISHEIRTPLNHILGFTNIIIEEAGIADEYMDYLRIVERSGNDLLHIIEDIVNVAKIEAGYSNIEEVEFDFNSLIYDLFTKYQSGMVKAGKMVKIQYQSNIKHEDGFIIADEHKIVQVIDHLMSNAMKFTNEGFVNIETYIKDGMIEIVIRDSGIGISKENKEIIFEYFRQLEFQNKKLFGGTGLGLAICKSLSLMMGGNVRVESDLGNGSTFVFSFPYKKGEEENCLSLIAIAPIKLDSKVIMIVEDDRINYIYLNSIVAKTKAKVIWMKNGLEAVEYLMAKKPCDLIYMDMQMPVMNGYDATTKIRALNKDIVIIAQTANVMADDRQRCLNLGCTDYTKKPIKQDIIFAQLNHYLGGKV